MKRTLKAMISPIRKVEDFLKRIHFEILTDLLFALSLRRYCLCRRKPNGRKSSFHCTSYILITSCYNMKARLEYKPIRTYRPNTFKTFWPGICESDPQGIESETTGCPSEIFCCLLRSQQLGNPLSPTYHGLHLLII